MNTDTIVAQCTPVGTGALALLRISGPHACQIAHSAARLSSKIALIDVPSHTIHHGWVVHNDQVLDEVLFFVMHAPRTFTGEHTVEISCHNNPFIIENIIHALVSLGARVAFPGEFSRQAVENEKLDILQAEAIKELIHAQSQESLKLSLQQLRGSFSSAIKELEHPMIQAIGLCEASFEFLEEDMDFSEQLFELLSAIKTKTSVLLTLFDQQKQIRDGVRIALIGSVNVGKSSLFNALLGKKRAIVTDIAGTTRDVIEASFYDNGLYWTLIDTAGLRTTNDTIEQEGIERSYREAQSADIILLVFDQSRSLTQDEQVIYNNILELYPEKALLISNKCDLNRTSPAFFNNKKAHNVSAQQENGIAELKNILAQKISDLMGQAQSPYLVNKRHTHLLFSFNQEVEQALYLLKNQPDYELISLHLQKGLALISELTGKTISEKAMDAVFKDFCVGK